MRRQARERRGDLRVENRANLPDYGKKHLEILSEIAELLSDAPLREKMKSCNDAVELHRLIATWQSAQPA